PRGARRRSWIKKEKRMRLESSDKHKQTLEVAVLCPSKGLAYDLEELGAEAGSKKKSVCASKAPTSISKRLKWRFYATARGLLMTPRS
ncbi:hypothetical protein, partial [Halobacillus litoralis]|uniref:hypothetical protein n=1 Tax=Halobacillus litoralis TaxID=45668 RepID=UPI00248F4EFA